MMNIHRNRRALVNQIETSLPTRQHGLGVLEVLIALVVVSFGVLGMASLQLTGMKHSSGGYNRTKALLFAQNMSSRLRINSDAIDAQDYAGYSSAGVDCGLPPAPYCQAKSGVVAVPSCNSSELAAFDTFTVACGDVGSSGAQDGVIGTLPNGQLDIECLGVACNADSTYQVSVSWSEGRARTTTNELITRTVQVRLKP